MQFFGSVGHYFTPVFIWSGLVWSGLFHIEQLRTVKFTGVWGGMGLDLSQTTAK